MDFQNRAGGKTGGGGVASAQDAGVDRRERLRYTLSSSTLYQIKYTYVPMNLFVFIPLKIK